MHRVSSLLLLCTLLLAACEFQSQPLEDRACSADSECTEGERCIYGYCALTLDVALDTAVEDIGDTLEDTDDVLRIPCGEQVCAGSGVACCEDADDKRCVVLSGDRENCGACGIRCGEEQGCIAGACACPVGTEDCDGDGTCESELLSDPEACGGCGITCAADQACQDGQCLCGSVACNADEVCCSGACQDTTGSLEHCGACGTACGTGESCVDGACTCGQAGPCASGTVCCGGSCVAPQHPSCACGALPNCDANQLCCSDTCLDVDSDSANCGACGVTCSGDEICSGGTCACPSATPNSCSGNTCVDWMSDENHCGACDKSCASGETCCGGSCVNTESDPMHCGGCFQVDAGAQRCTSVQQCCAGACREATDVAHCGACGNDCRTHAGVISGGGTTSCVSNQCTYDCAALVDDCTTALGCETSTAADDANCGACGMTCLGNQRCDNGVCQFDLPTSDLVLHYAFETSSGPVLDSSGQGLDGTATGGATRGTSGKIGNGLDLDGNLGSGVEVADDPLFSFGAAFTAEAWILPKACAGSWNTVVVQEGAFLFTFDPACNATNWVNIAGTGWIFYASGGVITPGVWQHYAMTFDGSVMRTYINGLEVGSSEPAPGSITERTGAVYIGRRPAVTATEQIFAGSMDEVKLWNHALTEEEICTSAGGVYTATPSAACAL